MRITQRPSPNRNIGRQGHIPDFIVFHTTGGSFQSAINTILNPANQVSYHFVISRKGEIIQAVDLENTAWANGTTNNGDNRDNRHSTISVVRERRINANLYTVSIGFGDMPAGNPSPQQIDAAVALVRHIRLEIERIYNYTIPITRNHIIGHNEITPITRPNCPGRAFPFDDIIRRINEVQPEPSLPVAPAEEAIPAWGIASWEWAAKNGILNDGRPHQNATRLEIITFIHRLYNFLIRELDKN